jgi:hypothetical protein
MFFRESQQSAVWGHFNLTSKPVVVARTHSVCIRLGKLSSLPRCGKLNFLSDICAPTGWTVCNSDAFSNPFLSKSKTVEVYTSTVDALVARSDVLSNRSFIELSSSCRIVYNYLK